MKTVTVRTASGQHTVKLIAADETDELTGNLARAARNIAAGVGAYATVTDGRSTYRVTKSVRRVADLA